MKVGFVSDIHEDIVSLEKAILEIEKKGCDEIVCLGDMIGFNVPDFGYLETRSARKCIDIIKSNCKYVVAGNHDLYFIKRIPEFNAGFEYPENWYDMDYDERKTLASDQVWLNEEIELNPLIGEKHMSFLRNIPECTIADFEGRMVFLSHYLYPDYSGSHTQYYHNFGPVKPHLEKIKESKCKIGFSGHKHIEGIISFNEKKQSFYPFGQYQLNNEVQWIVGPCIANGRNASGYLIFDTERLILDVIALKSPKRAMITVEID
jgi:predicted phosphodiesterase